MIDWIAHWCELVERRHDQGRRLDTRHGRPDVWAGRADRFAHYVAHSEGQDPLAERLLERVGAEMTVLDVGAGPGRHALPLARIAKRVVAVEPSAAMREQLRLRSEGLANLDVVADSWPSAWESGSVELADIVVCSHVLYPVVEVEPFLRALDAATLGTCYIGLRTGQREAPFLDLFEAIWKEPRALAPTAFELFNALHQLGIHANFELVPHPPWRGYADLDEAVEEIRREVLNPTHADARIRSWLNDRLVDKDGQLDLPDIEPPRAAIVSWEKQPRRR